MPGFFNSLSSYFSQPSQPSSNNPHTQTRSHRPPPDVLSSTRDAFSLPSHYGNGRSGSPVGGGSAYGGGGSGRRSYQDDASASASRSESPAYGEHVGTLSRPDRANLGVSILDLLVGWPRVGGCGVVISCTDKVVMGDEISLIGSECFDIST
jgi:hypothetical protein